jgi:hypothetical protein
MWLMDGSTVINSSFIANIWTGWSIVGIGDFDGDDNADILWRDGAGNEVIWFMNGTSISRLHGIGI